MISLLDYALQESKTRVSNIYERECQIIMHEIIEAELDEMTKHKES